jgi:hypothetical protein
VVVRLKLVLEGHNYSGFGASVSISGGRNAMAVTNIKHWAPFADVGGLLK